MAEPRYAELRSTKPLVSDFSKHSIIKLNKSQFSIGRSLSNSEVIPFVGISRTHCILQQNSEKLWMIKDVSRFGTIINGISLDKSNDIILKDNDIIQLDLNGEFTYSFYSNSVLPKSVKRRHSDSSNMSDVEERIQDAKDKFNSTQTFEIVNMEKKIMIAEKHHLDTVNEKVVLETCLSNEIVNLENSLRNKMVDLVGEDSETSKQRELLEIQLSNDKETVRRTMNISITNLEKKINEQKCQKILLENDNKQLLDRLKKERENFERRIEEVAHVKQRKLDLLEKKLAEREDERQAEEKNRLNQVQQQKLAQEQELKDLKATMESDQNCRQKVIDALKLEMQKQDHLSKESKVAREKEFSTKLKEMKDEAEKAKKILNDTFEQHHAKLEAEKMLAEEKLQKEKKELQQHLDEREKEKQQLQEALLAKDKIEQSLKKIQQDLLERETSVRHQMEEEKASWMSMLAREAETRDSTVKQLQEELDKFKSEKNLSAKMESPASIIEENQSETPSTSNNPSQSLPTAIINEFNHLMESELQCSICAELFIEATTLNCSHTFCKLCISTWKRKKRDCPICRTNITSECRSLVLDTFIEKMVNNLDSTVKEKRLQTLQERSDMQNIQTIDLTGRSAWNTNDRLTVRLNESSDSDSDDYNEWGDDFHDLDHEYQNLSDFSFGFRRRYYGSHDYTSDDELSSEGWSDSDDQYSHRSDQPSPAHSNLDDSTTTSNTSGGEQTNETSPAIVPTEVNSHYYGGYGKCFTCGAVGHWSPGCPQR